MVDAILYPNVVPGAVPTGQASGGPQARIVVHWANQFSDQSIRGAAKIDPTQAAYFVTLGKRPEFPRNNALNHPLITTDKVVSQTQATQGAADAWKKQTLPAWLIRFAPGAKEQKPAPVPWLKKFIPPLALFNDASQWVNRLMFNRPMQPWGGGDSDPPLKAQYFTPPPLNSLTNLAAGQMNAQLQLGMMSIQAANLTVSASNYFGGS